MKTLFQRVSISMLVAFALSGCSVVNEQRVDLLIEKTEITSFETVIAEVSNLNEQFGEDNVLIVLDIDNTLLTSAVDIGGDIWYQWQRGRLPIKPSETQTVPCLFEDSIGLLYELGPMRLIEEGTPAVISDWQTAGNTVMALTSRAPKYRAATERELYNKGIDLEVTALAPIDEPAPVYRENIGRELSYMKGIMMTSGMNKGEMLNYILEKTKRTFDAVVFVDDSIKNIDNVYEKYKKNNDIDVNIYHYVKVEKDREKKYGSVLTDDQAEKMVQDWLALTTALQAIFPDRNLAKDCLSVN